jgi:Carboxypeptidase regulatory-like domain
MGVQSKFTFAIRASTTLMCASLCLAQVAQPKPVSIPEHPVASPVGEQPDPPSSGCINGTVVDQSGAVVAGATVRVTRDGQSSSQEVVTGSNGQFFLANIAPGAFELTITSAGFAPQTYSGILHSGEIETVPLIAMGVASAHIEVEVGITGTEVAEEQIKIEEKQRVIGIIPNFYVSYIPNAAPLSSKQKFKLAARTVVDPFTFVVVAGAAGIEQWQNHFIGYGQGVQGYAKRFGANYGDTLTSTFIGGAILPSLLKQDPRYFYKGTGSLQARFLYAIAMSVICKGDNRRWQPNYSNILGSLASGGISNLYYPPQDRNSAGLTFDNAAIAIASNAMGNLLQEFIIPRLTPHRPHAVLAQP